jgi:hypothetical protein
MINSWLLQHIIFLFLVSALYCEPCRGPNEVLEAAFDRGEGVDEHPGQGEEHVGFHSSQPSHPEIVQVEVAFQPGEDAFDALPLPLQPPIQRRPTLDDRVEPQPLRQGFRLPVPPGWERDHGTSAIAS